MGQGNNAFVFPGIGFAAILGRCKCIGDAMIVESAFALAKYTDKHYHGLGRIFAPIKDLQQVSMVVAAQVLATALTDGSATRTDLDGGDLGAIMDLVRSRVRVPRYLPFGVAENAL